MDAVESYPMTGQRRSSIAKEGKTFQAQEGGLELYLFIRATFQVEHLARLASQMRGSSLCVSRCWAVPSCHVDGESQGDSPPCLTHLIPTRNNANEPKPVRELVIHKVTWAVFPLPCYVHLASVVHPSSLSGFVTHQCPTSVARYFCLFPFMWHPICLQYQGAKFIVQESPSH